MTEKTDKTWSSDRIREAFLSFFESKGHRRLSSASLVPVSDPSLLLINAGMAPLKRYFEGSEAPPAPRCCSSQKCIRTIDIDEVGRTNRHNTFFEMLGNFSFGDYFKKDAIDFCWEFLTSPEWMNIPPERIYSTAHESDADAYALWEKVWRDAGYDPAKRIYKLGDKHNFWAAGATGPCGYDSEVYFDLAPETDEAAAGAPPVNTREWFEFWEERGRFIEVWNNVFMEFYRDESGGKTPLPKKNVDTGMGLERLVMVKQALEKGENWQTVFLTDLFDYIIEAVFRALKLGGSIEDFRARVNTYDFTGKFEPLVTIADHLRASVFLLGDGVTPTNEGRGYVLRRLVRRIVQYGFILTQGKAGRFIVPVAEEIIRRMGRAYPEIKSEADKIKKYLSHEEAQFLGLLERNYEGIYSAIERAKAEGAKLDGAVAFQFHDSQGFPIDVTRDLCAQFGVELDEEEYERLMKTQRERARASAKFETDFGGEEGGQPLGEFCGYDRLEAETEIVYAALFKFESGRRVLKIVTKLSPFYAASGGQLGDVGTIEIGDLILKVFNSPEKGHHICEIPIGADVDELAKSINGKAAVLRVDATKRQAISRAHTATHLLHKALKTVLGNHVQQAGSQLYYDSFRFDFSHTSPMTAAEIAEVERLVRGWIVESHPVTTEEMPLKRAKALGVTALFDEKYGEVVRVVTVGTPGEGGEAERVLTPHYPWVQEAVVSRELCGGTHVARSSDIAGFVVISEIGISAGMRRITASTGRDAWREIAEDSGFARRMKTAYNLPYEQIEAKVAETETELKLTREKLINAERERILDVWLEKAQTAYSGAAVFWAEMADAHNRFDYDAIEKPAAILVDEFAGPDDSVYADRVTLSEQLNIECLNASATDFSPDFASLIPAKWIFQYQAIPLGLMDGGQLRVAIIDPLNFLAIDEIRLHTGYEISPVLLSPEDFRIAIGKLLKAEYGAATVLLVVENVGRESLKYLADRISERYSDAIVLLGENDGGKAAFVCKVPPALVAKGYKAGDIVRVAAQACGGGGGGRPDFAEAGGKDGERVKDGIEAAKEFIAGKGDF